MAAIKPRKPSAVPARPRGASARRSKSLVLFWSSLAVGVLAIGTVLVLVPQFGRGTPAPGELITGDIDSHRLGAIVSDDGRTKCARATFDNRTGKISPAPVFCETAAATEGPPVPRGTVQTLNAISNSFK
jgi:hypothetical protein